MRDTLTWLHISDIHFHPRTDWRDSIVRTGLLEYLKAIFAADSSLRPDLVFCTGDIAYGETGFSPLVDQYTQASTFFDDLLSTCGREGTPLSRDRLYVVPGNHDVDRAAVNSDAQNTLVNWARDPEAHVKEINQRFNDRSKEFQDAVRRLDEYSQFVTRDLPHQRDDGGRQQYALVIPVDGLKVGIAGFNSAWSCAGPEDDRSIWLAAEWQFNAAHTVVGNAEVRIGLIHHPVDWLNESERRFVRERISRQFHFWLHGHSHDAWITPADSHVTIAAGAVGAEKTDEFGVNIVRLDLQGSSGVVHLHGHTAGGTSWTVAPVEVLAPAGTWPFNLPGSLRERFAQKPADSSHSVPAKRGMKIFGRDALLAEAAGKLERARFLFVYGLRGNGKTKLIEKLGERPPLAGKECLRIAAGPETTADELFRQFATLVGDTSDFPRPPQGDWTAIAEESKRRYRNPRPAWIWIDRAHHLFRGDTFVRADVRDLLLGLQAGVGDQWHLLLEMRERPPRNVLSAVAAACEVPGLNKASLADCLIDAAPQGREQEWKYTGVRLKAIFQWLGGGQGAYAHAQATQLLIEVARGRDETPWDVHERHRSDFTQKVEDVLLGDLYENVLNEQEHRLLLALSLYRDAIPHDHADALENALHVVGAWDGLDRRCLLTASPNHQEFYLHSLIASWLRTRFLGYAVEDESAFVETTYEAPRQLARELHEAIASCWLDQLGSARRRTNVNIARAVEAFHHLVAAGDVDRVQHVAVELLGGNLKWAQRRMREFQEYLYRTRAPLTQQRAALEYRAALDPDDHAVQRFLGECWQKLEGAGSAKALKCFQNACQLRRDFPPYWANLGMAMLAQGPASAAGFLAQTDLLDTDCPRAIDDHVWAIRSDCLELVGESKKASELRMAKINAGSRNAAFYNDEAKARLETGDTDGALKVLDLADENGCADDFTAAVRTSVLQRTDPKKASGDIQPAHVADPPAST